MVHFLAHGKDDSVGVAVVDLKAGQTAEGWNTEKEEAVQVKANSDIPLGHKIALADIKQGGTVIKYNCPIGAASQSIRRGDHVHTHNLKSKRWTA
ncbi:MAG: UxaA family hydrolase [Candidatus Sumerlaeota bacterium]|nr:UxaA family hydrolase [Candidatus Sumerlaeota bacterium]